jgi:cell division protein FtsQ
MNELEHHQLKMRKEKAWGMGFLIVVFTSLIIGGTVLTNWMVDEQQVPISSVQISGHYTYIKDRDISRLIANDIEGSFFSADINDIHSAVLKHPWVYQASVRKKWPNTIQVYLVEQTPVAIWNGDLLLNAEGIPFVGSVAGAQLPLLFGPNGAEKTSLSGYQAMQMILSTGTLTVKNLVLSERFAWQVQLNNGIKLNLGRQEFINRLQRFINLYPLLQQDERDINYVDLRYDTGMAVGWQA